MCSLTFLLMYSSNKITVDTDNNEMRANNEIRVISTTGTCAQRNVQHFNQNNKIEMKNVPNKWKC